VTVAVIWNSSTKGAAEHIRMRKLPRVIPAIVLIVLYAMIVLSPLAPMALRSPMIAHAITGECASDCSICRCSPERSANHTCCCWQKKRINDHKAEQDESECCSKKHLGKIVTFTISTNSCGDNKSIAFFGVGHSKLLPFLFSLDNLAIFESSLNLHIVDYQSDWPGEPPDPPPKLIYTS
jgi:hypothetical protein